MTEKEKPTEQPQQAKPGEIEMHPSDFTYTVVVDDEVVQVPNMETALVLSKLERIHKELQELRNKK